MKKKLTRISSVMLLMSFCFTSQAQKEFYEIRIYKMKTADQITATDNYLRDSYLPTLHKLGIKNAGVFKLLTNDTSENKEIIVLVPYKSLDVWYKTKLNIETDPVNPNAAKTFADADTAHLPYHRMVSIITEAFPYQPKLIPTELKSNPEAVYEMRNYESPTEALHRLKVNMFNTGGEVALFKRLDFQAVFYSDVLSGDRMPDLIYMVVFSSLAARDEHWKAFGASPEWKSVSTDPQFRNNISVNHIDSRLMRRTPYSDL